MTLPRIAALQPSVSVTLAGLGRLDHLAACTRWCVEQVPELASRGLPVLADSWSASAADIAALRAAKVDIVIASVPYQQASLSALLQSGIPVLALAPHSLADIYAETRLLASIVGAGAEAEAMISGIQQQLAEVAARAAHSAVIPQISCEEWGLPQTASLIHSQAWVYELVRAAAGQPLGHPGSTVTSADIAAANPDALVLAWCGAGDRVPLRRVVDQRGWSQLPAVEQRRMYCVPDEWLNTPAIPSLLEGLAAVAHCVQPELFPAPPRLRRLAPA